MKRSRDLVLDDSPKSGVAPSDPALIRHKISYTVAQVCQMVGVSTADLIQASLGGDPKSKPLGETDYIDASRAIVALALEGKLPCEDTSLEAIVEHEYYQYRNLTNPEAVGRYAQAYQTEPKRVPPLVLWEKANRKYLLDGFHRVAAARALKIDVLPAFVVRCPDPVAAQLPLRFNERNGVPYSKSDRERAFMRLLDSNRKIKEELRDKTKGKAIKIGTLAKLYGMSPAGISRAMKRHDETRKGHALKAQKEYTEDLYQKNYLCFRHFVKLADKGAAKLDALQFSRLHYAYDFLEILLANALRVRPAELRAMLAKIRKEDWARLERMNREEPLDSPDPKLLIKGVHYGSFYDSQAENL